MRILWQCLHVKETFSTYVIQRKCFYRLFFHLFSFFSSLFALTEFILFGLSSSKKDVFSMTFLFNKSTLVLTKWIYTKTTVGLPNAAIEDAYLTRAFEEDNTISSFISWPFIYKSDLWQRFIWIFILFKCVTYALKKYQIQNNWFLYDFYSLIGTCHIL